MEQKRNDEKVREYFLNEGDFMNQQYRITLKRSAVVLCRHGYKLKLLRKSGNEFGVSLDG